MEGTIRLEKEWCWLFHGLFLPCSCRKIVKHAAPIKTKSNKILTLNGRAWISRAIGKSTKIRNKVYKNYLEKDPAKEKTTHEQFKTYRNKKLHWQELVQKTITANNSKKIKETQKEFGELLE